MTRQERKWGIDLLRMVSMYLVVILHVLGQGGAMVRISSHPQTYMACWLLETAAMCAVNCYGLISGYVGLSSSFRPGRLVRLWLSVLFWSVGIALAFLILRPEVLAQVEVPDAFAPLGPVVYQVLRYAMPATFKSYWYFSAYIAVFFLSPYLNRMVQGLTQAEAKRLLKLLFVLFSLFPMVPKVFGLDPLELVGGYTVIWLVALYIAGACLRLVRVEMTRRRRLLCILIFVLSTLVSWGYKMGMEDLTRAALGQAMYGRLLVTYHAPTMVINGVCLLLIFQDLPINAGWANRLVRLLSPVAFQVYLIHTHPLIWEHVLKRAFAAFRSLSPAGVLLAVPAAALGIYLFCSLLGLLQHALFALAARIDRRRRC